jgi:hypothetical protein
MNGNPRDYLTIGYGYVKLHEETRAQLDVLLEQSQFANLDQLIRSLLPRGPSLHSLCGVETTWRGRRIHCRNRDRAHANSDDPSRRRHHWWAWNGKVVRWT